MMNGSFTAAELKEISGERLLKEYEEQSKVTVTMTGYRKLLWEEISWRLK